MCTASEKVLSKIRKLLELGNSSRNTSEAEATEALAKAQLLMAKYGVADTDLTELARDESNVISVVCEHKWDMGYRKPLASVISENYRCRVYCRGSHIMFMGVQEDAEIAKSAFEFAYKFIMRRGNQEYEKVRKAGYDGKGVFNSYAIGFISGLREILTAQAKALMIVVPDTVVEAFNQLSLGKASGGMQNNGYYSDIVAKGKKDAKDYFGRAALPSNC